MQPFHQLPSDFVSRFEYWFLLVSEGCVAELEFCNEQFHIVSNFWQSVVVFENRELKHRRFWATDVNRKFMFLLLARFHARPLSYKALILGFTTWYFQQKGSNTRRKGEILTSGWRPWLKNVCA